MKNGNKTKKQLMDELIELRKEIKKLQTQVSKSKCREKALSNINDLKETTEALLEHKRMEQELAYFRRQYELILQSAGEGILGLDLEGRHTFVNPAAARMLGYEDQELIGRLSHAIWHYSKPDGTAYPMEECPIYAAFRDGFVYQRADEVFWRKDGTNFPIEYTSTPILQEDKIIGAVAILFGIKCA
ncbi:MAG TPA: PAS domain-containing protein [archaeon]|nr:PAS domain-containing protein [archaeon]